MQNNKPTRINCVKCIHYRITWETKHPMSCRFFGFKGNELPSITVYKTTGSPCPEFKKR